MQEPLELKIKIFGRVQGVNFRNTAKRIADSLGVKGWVRNELDGSVNIVCQGSMDILKEFIDEIKASPGLSAVNNLETHKNGISEIFKDFKVVREGGFFTDQRQSFKNLGKEIFKV